VALSANPWQNLRTAILPAVALALPQVAVFSRLLRGDMRTTLEQDFVAFADSKGISTWRILIGHALRPSSFSLVTVAGLQVGFLMGGTVVVETLFNVPGIGSLLVNAIYQRDLLTVQGVTLFIAAVFVVVNFIVDLLYSVLDPRIRRGSVVATA
jgi:peptide/nickel transport system permease protein